MASKVADTRTLPSKEATLFRQLVKHYETKQYKKGIKAADTILKKFPEHGETLAMKGLLLNCMERKEEAYELVKRGVKNDIRSHVCWHVYGLLYRSDREYEEAIKCYKNALRMDKDNLQVLRDLALLQIQMRDLAGFLESRQQLLDLKPSNKQSWVSFALAHHLCGHHEVAAKVLDAFQATMDEEVPASEAYEHSELLMYKARILEEAPEGLHAEALAVLDDADAKGQIKDRLGLLEARGRLFMALQRWQEAEGVYRRLVAINPDNHRYHHGLLAALRLAPVPPAVAATTSAAPPADLVPDFGLLSEEQRAQLAAVYAELAAQHPHSAACRRLPLDFLTGEAFEAAAAAYARRYVQKGIPSLFRDLRPLYRDPAKRDALGRLFRELERSLPAEGSGEQQQQQQHVAAAAEEEEQQQSLSPGGGEAEQHGHGHSHGHRHVPQPLLWVRLYLAQHADLLGDTGEALRLIDQCLELSPLLVEAHSIRARVLRHAGDLEGAARSADKARSMDLSDRYLNCLAVKALFRAGRVGEGEKLAALFTRDGELANNLFDMQAMWYEIHSGRAFLEKKDYGRALKRFLKVDAHFADFVEDQFDFHGYCVRKQTMRAYVDMLRMEDKLYAHPTYSKAISGAIQSYLDLYDHPPKSAEQQEEEALAGMSAEEQKKYRQRKRKEEQRKQKEAADAAAAEAATASKKGDKEPKKKDPDPNGVQLAATSDPLGEASKLVKRLCEHAGESLSTHLMAFEVYLRKGRQLLALRAVKHALQLAGAAHPRVHLALLRLAQRTQQPAAAAAAPAAAADRAVAAGPGTDLVGELLEQWVAAALGGLPVEAYHQQWAQQHGGDSLAAAAAVAEGSAALQLGLAAAAAQGLLQAASPEGASHADCVAVHVLLRDKLGDPAAAEQWRERCACVLRWSRYFGGREVMPLEEAEGAAVAAVNGVAERVAALAV